MARLTAALAGLKLYAVVFAVGLAVGFGGCWKLRDAMAAEAKLDAADARTAAAVRTIEAAEASTAAGAALGERSARTLQEIRVEYRTLIEKVPVYVTAESDRQCPVPVGFVRLHDAAAAGAPAVSDAAGPPHDAASGVALSTVGATVTDNYGACRDTAQRLSDLQGWVREQRDLWNGRP